MMGLACPENDEEDLFIRGLLFGKSVKSGLLEELLPEIIEEEEK